MEEWESAFRIEACEVCEVCFKHSTEDLIALRTTVSLLNEI
jgi:hypothetical protein